MEAKVMESDRLTSHLEENTQHYFGMEAWLIETEAKLSEASTMHAKVFEELSQAVDASGILEAKLVSFEANKANLLVELLMCIEYCISLYCNETKSITT